MHGLAALRLSRMFNRVLDVCENQTMPMTLAQDRHLLNDRSMQVMFWYSRQKGQTNWQLYIWFHIGWNKNRSRCKTQPMWPNKCYSGFLTLVCQLSPIFMFCCGTFNSAQSADVTYDLYECVLVVLDAHRFRCSVCHGWWSFTTTRSAKQLKTTCFCHQKARKQRVNLALQARIQIVPS